MKIMIIFVVAALLPVPSPAQVPAPNVSARGEIACARNRSVTIQELNMEITTKGFFQIVTMFEDSPMFGLKGLKLKTLSPTSRLSIQGTASLNRSSDDNSSGYGLSSIFLEAHPFSRLLAAVELAHFRKQV